MRSVKVRRARFRERPAAEADVLFTADRYYPVRIVKRKRGWARVEDFEGELAWVAERLLARTPGVVVVPRVLTFRENPSDESRAVFEAKRSDSFKAIQWKGGWVKVEGSKGKRGWARVSKLWGQTSQPKRATRRHKKRR